MPRGRTSSPLSRSARLERASNLYARGYSIADVARELSVSPDTASRYKKQYDESLKDQARLNPDLLQDVLRNTFQSLRELEQVQQQAWTRYEGAQTDQTRAAFLNTALKAQEQKAKLFQLFGVKATFLAKVAHIQAQQRAFITFLGEANFCDRDRDLIAEFLASQVDVSDLTQIPEIEEPTRP